MDQEHKSEATKQKQASQPRHADVAKKKAGTETKGVGRRSKSAAPKQSKT